MEDKIKDKGCFWRIFMQNSQLFEGLRLIVVLLSWIFFSLGSLLLRLFLVFKLSSLKVWKCTDLGAKIFGLKEFSNLSSCPSFPINSGLINFSFSIETSLSFTINSIILPSKQKNSNIKLLFFLELSKGTGDFDSLL